MESDLEKIRLDQWLWAARFFKTRQRCQQAIIGGKVHQQQQRCKPGQAVHIGMQLTIRQGYDLKTIEILTLNRTRGDAKCAATMYQELAASRIAREAAAKVRQLNKLAAPQDTTKPTKKERRQLEYLKRDP
jgi:ribosome-associated heat shock protein Hsp15